CWAEDFSSSMSVWLSAATGARQQSCKEQVRVAHALGELPCLSSAFGSGSVPRDKVAALTRFVTPDNDQVWTSRACSWSAFELEREARRASRVTEEQDEADRESGFVRTWWCRDGRLLKLNGQLAAAAGAGVEAGVQLRAEAVRRMVCDGRIEFSIQDQFGRCVGIGRASRKIPGWLERQVLLRDGHCRFPGCDRTTLLHCHHVIPWIQGGPTN